MALEIKIPSVGESVQEAVLGQWYKKDGETVQKDEVLFVIETDKVTLEVTAEAAGTLQVLIAEGETVAIGATVGRIDTDAVAAQAPQKAEPASEQKKPVEQAAEKNTPPTKPTVAAQPPETVALPVTAETGVQNLPQSPAVRRLIAEKGIDISNIKGTGPAGRVTKGDVLLHLEQAPAGVPDTCVPPADLDPTGPAAEVRKKMSPIRKRIASRLLEARQNTAMLTTFNDIDMSNVMALRTQYKTAFADKHEVALGFMSFFVKACVAALQEIPEINAFVENDEFVYHNYQHIGIAIGSERGLVVPVIRHAERLNFAEIEKAIVDYVAKIQQNKLELADLEGGTFSISNGGVYGSLLSTPILNTPQSGILGMHRIEKRPVAVDDQVVIRPMMYVALSYDHRIVDGRGAVTFLKRVKQMVENPERMLLEV